MTRCKTRDPMIQFNLLGMGFGTVAVALSFAAHAAHPPVNTATIAEVDANSVAAAPEFNAEADCKAQPYGLSRSTSPATPENELLPEISAEAEPEFLPVDRMKDFFIQMVTPVLGVHTVPMVEAMRGICISKKEHDLLISIYFKSPHDLKLKNIGEAYKMETYRIMFPTLLRLKVMKNGQFVNVNFSGRFLNALRMLVRVPVLKDLIYVHRMEINTKTLWTRVIANAMRDRVGIVAWTKLDLHKPLSETRLISRIAKGATLLRLLRGGRY